MFGLQRMEEVEFNQHLDEFDKVMMELASLPSSFHNIVATILFGKRPRDLMKWLLPC